MKAIQLLKLFLAQLFKLTTARVLINIEALNVYLAFEVSKRLSPRLGGTGLIC